MTEILRFRTNRGGWQTAAVMKRNVLTCWVKLHNGKSIKRKLGRDYGPGVSETKRKELPPMPEGKVTYQPGEVDIRSKLLRALEWPFRLVGIIRYDPMEKGVWATVVGGDNEGVYWVPYE